MPLELLRNEYSFSYNYKKTSLIKFMDNNFKYLIQTIGILKEHYDIAREEEEKFNIFSVMYKEHDERKLHSRFVAALLNPSGSHDLKDYFLKYFIGLFKEIDFSNFRNAIVYPDELNKKENNNIDILIIDRTSRNAIIIENKIYAGDSNSEAGGQLERYYRHVRENENISEENISVLYLTLDGHEPSTKSLGEFKTLERIKGQCISYEAHILRWLKLCLKDVYNKPFIRESILQYEKLINKMTNSNTDIKERIKLKEIIGHNKDSMNATKYLLDNFKHVKWHAIDDFWNELEMELNGRGLNTVKSIDPDSITQLTHFQNNKNGEEGGISFKVNEGLNGFVWHEKNEWLFWGFEKEGINDTQKEILDNLTRDGHIVESSTYWYKYFEFSDGEMLWLKDFTKERTFNLIDPLARKETVMKIVNEVLNFISSEMNKSS